MFGAAEIELKPNYYVAFTSRAYQFPVLTTVPQPVCASNNDDK